MKLGLTVKIFVLLYDHVVSAAEFVCDSFA